MNEEFRKLIEVTIEWLKSMEDKCNSKEDRPKMGEHYWAINAKGGVVEYGWTGVEFDEEALENNAIFRTEAEAEFEAERLKVLRELEKLGRPFKPGEDNYEIHYDHHVRELDIFEHITCQGGYGNCYFDTEKEAWQAIDIIGADRIKKYLFRVED